MKPFNLALALAGKPVQLRTGQKVVILYYIPEVYKYGDGTSVTHPLRGIIFNKQGKIITANEGWTEDGAIALNHEHVYLNDMYFFMNQGYIVLDNDCVPVNPIILTDDMIGKQVQLLNGQIHTVYRDMHDSHYTIGKFVYDCLGHSRIMPTTEDSIPLMYHVLGPVELKYNPSLNSAFNTAKYKYINSPIGYKDYLDTL